MSTILRQTTETRVVVELSRGEGPIRIDTKEPFLSHMVTTLARYAGFSVELSASGDLRHHVVEDVAITLGRALADEVPESVARYGWAVVPMDDALVEAAVDLGGRPWYDGRLPSKLYEHFLRSFSTNLNATVHVHLVRGRDRHHVVEAAVKAVGLSLRQALEENKGGTFSTKGSVKLERGKKSAPAGPPAKPAKRPKAGG